MIYTIYGVVLSRIYCKKILHLYPKKVFFFCFFIPYSVTYSNDSFRLPTNLYSCVQITQFLGLKCLEEDKSEDIWLKFDKNAFLWCWTYVWETFILSVFKSLRIWFFDTSMRLNKYSILKLNFLIRYLSVQMYLPVGL